MARHIFGSDENIDDLKNLWLKIALGTTSHRYFLHVDPMLTNITGLSNLQRSHLYWEYSKERYEKLNELIANAIGHCVGGLAELVVRRRVGLQSLRIKISPGMVSPQPSDNPGELQRLHSALHQLENSPVKDIVMLGARLFVPAPVVFSPSIAVLLGAVAVDAGVSVEACARKIATAAAHNLLLQFLLASRIVVLEEIAGTIEEMQSKYGSLLEAVGKAIGVLGSSQASDQPLFSDCPADLMDSVSTIGYLPAEDFVLSVCNLPGQFKQFYEGLGVGQS